MKQTSLALAVLCIYSSLLELRAQGLVNKAAADNTAVDIPLNAASASHLAAAPQVRDSAESSPTKSTNADQLILHAAKILPQYQSIQAKIRQRIDLYEKSMVGSGIYVQQQGRGGDLLLRLELKMVLSDQSLGSFLQVCDGPNLWTYQDQGDRPSSLTRIDMQQVRAAWERSDPWIRSGGIGSLGLGGIPRMLTGMTQSFQFTEAEQTQLEGFPVWIVRGGWQPAKLATMLPDQKDALAKGEPANLRDLPKQVPWAVEVVLGRDDFFPYRVKYLRPPAKKEKALGKASLTEILAASSAIATLEFFEVKLNSPLDGQPFVYQPGMIEAVDKTESVLKAFGLTEAGATK